MCPTDYFLGIHISWIGNNFLSSNFNGKMFSRSINPIGCPSFSWHSRTYKRTNRRMFIALRRDIGSYPSRSNDSLKLTSILVYRRELRTIFQLFNWFLKKCVTKIEKVISILCVTVKNKKEGGGWAGRHNSFIGNKNENKFKRWKERHYDWYQKVKIYIS